jgi:hypothetical protein
LDTLSYNISNLPKKSEINQLSIAEKKVLEASTIIKLIDPEVLEQADENNFRNSLDSTINIVSELISSVTSSLSSLYFNHSVMQLSLATDKNNLMKYKLTHKTTYTYTDAIHNYQCIVCLHPITSERQNCEDFKLTIEPNPQNLFARTDYFGNTQYFFNFKTT